MPPPMTSLATHPERNSIRLQLRQNLLLQGISAAQWSELEPLLLVADYRKGEPLVHQGDEEMEQFFIVDGMLKRDRKSTRLNSSHLVISYAVFCLKKKIS